MDALCASIREGGHQDQRPIGMRPSYRYSTRDAVVTILNDFSDIFVVQHDPRAIETIVRQDSGRLMCLGAPSGWYLCLRPQDHIVPFSGHPNWEDFPGTPRGLYTLLGQIIRRPRTGAACQELPWLVYLGPHGQLLCYATDTMTVFVLALSIDELSRRGLVSCELLYTGEHLPRTTRVPEKLVAELLAGDVHDGRAVAERAKHRQGRTILLHTPGEGDRPLILCGTNECLRSWWPFLKMTNAELDVFRTEITRKMRDRPWFLFGVVGLRVGPDPLRVESVLILNETGAIFHVDPDRHHSWRIADSLPQLFGMGLQKLYLPRRRLDRGTLGRDRLESPGCAHVGVAAWNDRYEVLGARPRQDFGALLRWLLREGRFDEPAGTWDENDALMRKDFDATTRDTVRRNAELAYAADEAEYGLRGCPPGYLDDACNRPLSEVRLGDGPGDDGE